MAFTREYCDDRARDAAKAASLATLDNVRQRELRSEAAWRTMSDRIRQTEAARSVREAQRLCQTGADRPLAPASD